MNFLEELLPSFQAEELLSLLCLGEIFALAYLVTFFVWPRREDNNSGTASKPK